MYIIFGRVADQTTGSGIGKMLLDKRQGYATRLVAFPGQLMVPMYSYPIPVIADGGLFLYATNAIVSLVLN